MVGGKPDIGKKYPAYFLCSSFTNKKYKFSSFFTLLVVPLINSCHSCICVLNSIHILDNCAVVDLFLLHYLFGICVLTKSMPQAESLDCELI